MQKGVLRIQKHRMRPRLRAQNVAVFLFFSLSGTKEICVMLTARGSGAGGAPRTMDGVHRSHRVADVSRTCLADEVIVAIPRHTSREHRPAGPRQVSPVSRRKAHILGGRGRAPIRMLCCVGPAAGPSAVGPRGLPADGAWNVQAAAKPAATRRREAMAKRPRATPRFFVIFGGYVTARRGYCLLGMGKAVAAPPGTSHRLAIVVCALVSRNANFSRG